MADTVFENPYVKGLLYGVVHSMIDEGKITPEQSKDRVNELLLNAEKTVHKNHDLNL